uniref:Peptidase S1 domain-containing protein n=1 Tax=Poecilia reticulata TaxID=8081 RepID=A0A3P9P667_POERE
CCRLLLCVLPVAALCVAVCGSAPLGSSRGPRIVGGQDAAAGAWPWQVSLHQGGHFCGGSLITPITWRLRSPGGSDHLAAWHHATADGFPPVSRVITHPDYNDQTKDNDVALLQLQEAVTFTDYIRPVCLAAAGSDFPAGQSSWITGWGDVRFQGEDPHRPLPFPQTLQEAEIPVVSNSQCSTSYDSITSNMICAGLTEGGRDTCQGDSGGPMVSNDGTRWVQSGIVSFGFECARPGYPGVYARVSRYQDWISKQLGADPLGFVTFRGSPSAAPHWAAGSVLPALCCLLVLF